MTSRLGTGKRITFFYSVQFHFCEYMFQIFGTVRHTNLGFPVPEPVYVHVQAAVAIGLMAASVTIGLSAAAVAVGLMAAVIITLVVAI